MIYYLEAYRWPDGKEDFCCFPDEERYNSYEEMRQSIADTEYLGAITICYFRVKLKDGKNSI